MATNKTERLIERIRSLEKEVERLALSHSKLEECNRRLMLANEELETTQSHLVYIAEHSNQIAVDAEVSQIESRQIFNTSSDGIWVIDTNHEVQRINDPLLSVIQKSETQALGQKCYELLPGPNCHSRHCPLNRLKTGESRVEFDVEVPDQNGHETPYIVTATPFRGLDGSLIGIIESFKNIADRKKIETELQKVNHELQRIATIDELTQIANRRRFDACLALEWRRMKREALPLSLIICDIDYFKMYNDRYGHQKGDECLQKVAQIIASQVERPADLAARYGGEEFAVILPNTPLEGAICVAEKIRNAVYDRCIAHADSKIDCCVTLSLGVASVIPSNADTAKTLIQSADKALYAAKSMGRNRALADAHLQPN